MDKWIPAAERSNVLREENVLWVTAKGIPIHLRSTDLFRQLGEACGSYLEHQAGDSLSSVRLKIKLSGALPEEISFISGDEVFPVSICPDGFSHHAILHVAPVPSRDWKSKDKASLFPKLLNDCHQECSSS
ncbi:hypothetical protein LINPERHAP2_LOCUS174 [Linum perenne]